MDLTPQELEELKILMDPVGFAKYHFDWEARYYQEEILRSTHKRKRLITRMGRRTGKSDSISIHSIWYTYTHEGSTCLVATPYESQVKLIFKKIRDFIEKSPAIKSSIKYSRMHPEYIEFYNGSIITGFTSGTKSGNEGGSIRGQGADWIYLDEMDYMSDEDINSIAAIATEDPGRIGIWASSTPTGRRGKFFDWCISAQGEGKISVEPGMYTGETWTEFYYPSYVIPTWDKENEKEFRSIFSDIGYEHEVLAEFGEEMVGVFNKEDVEKALEDYEYNPSPDYGTTRTIGVDWDKYGASTQIIILEFDNKSSNYKIINRIEIPRSQRTLTNAVETLVRLDNIYQPTHIYVDRGYGEMQVEFLTEHLGNKVRGIQMSEKIDVVDPITKIPDKKHVKPFMVNNAQIAIERGRLKISAYDTMVKEQLMNYRVIRETVLGQPVFTSENEHALDALMFALLAFTIEHPNIANVIKKTEYARKSYYIDDVPFGKTDEMRDKESSIEITTVTRRRYSGAPTWGPRGSPTGRRQYKPRRRRF